MRMDVIDPAGRMVKHYSRNITATAGKAQGTIPLALNDQQGLWTVKVKDWTSGKKAQASFVLKLE